MEKPRYSEKNLFYCPSAHHKRSLMLLCSKDASSWLSIRGCEFKKMYQVDEGPRFTIHKISGLKIQFFLASLWFWCTHSDGGERQDKEFSYLFIFSLFPYKYGRRKQAHDIQILLSCICGRSAALHFTFWISWSLVTNFRMCVIPMYGITLFNFLYTVITTCQAREHERWKQQ